MNDKQFNCVFATRRTSLQWSQEGAIIVERKPAVTKKS